MAREFFIPHNYKNNGRIFNMFDKKVVTKSLIWLVPVTAIIFILPLPFTIKCFVMTLVGIPPVFLIIFELDILLIRMLQFQKNAKIYYDKGKEGENVFYFEKNRQESRNQGGRIK